MKKKKFNKKLSLNKESIANLNSSELDNVKGGHNLTVYNSCNPNCNTNNTICRTCECPPETFNCEITNYPMNTCWMC